MFAAYFVSIRKKSKGKSAEKEKEKERENGSTASKHRANSRK